METILNNITRNGNFTSSEIVALTKSGKKAGEFGEKALTYIKECNMERRLGRSLDAEQNAKALSWGKLGEKRVFDILPMEYKLMGDETIGHPHIDCWFGSPDVTKIDTVGDVKCPLTLKSFCDLVDPLYNGLKDLAAMKAIIENHKDGDKYYWQLVSNAILTKSKFAELIVYVPYLSELHEIRSLANSQDGADIGKYYGIINSQDEELPYLIDGGYYKNLNVIRFEVPQIDIDFLTDRVIAAQLKLITAEKLAA